MGKFDTIAYKKIARMKSRIRIVQGGTSAGKTFSILSLILAYSFKYKNKLFSITTDSYPNLKRGAIRDFKKILTLSGTAPYFRENKTEHTFTNTCTGTEIEFFSCDEMGALGARRDFLFINEANRINYETFTQLETRTKERIWVDFNPVNEFWVHKDLLGNGEIAKKCEFIKLNYLDNDKLDKSIVESIEMRKGDGTSNWWRVFGLGEIGSLEGNVYEGWTSVEDIPEGFILQRYGVDFGFANDPTAVVGVYENDAGEICLKLEVYELGLLNPELIAKCKQLPEALFICDNARPEIIAEMQRSGLRAIGCDKTPGEKLNGKRYNIELVQRRKVYYLAGDRDLEREYLTYAWRKKKGTGEPLNEPVDGNDHAMDAIAYAVRDMEKAPLNLKDMESVGSYNEPVEQEDGWDDYDDDADEDY